MAGSLGAQLMSAAQQGMQGVSNAFKPPSNINPNSYGDSGIPDVEAAKASIANYGQQYQGATTQQQKDDIHNQATAIGTKAGGIYNSGTGQWDFSNVKAPNLKGTDRENVVGTGNGTNNNSNNNSLIKSIYDSMYASQAQKLKDTRDQQLAGLAGQDTLAQNNAQSALNANDVSGARLSNQLREHMANLGLLQGGDYISQQVGQNTAQGQNANQINMDLGNRLSQLAAQKDAINNNASANDLALLQNIQSQQGQSQLSDAYKQQDYGLNLSKESGILPNGGQTLGGKQLDQSIQNQQFNQNLDTQKFDQQKSQQAWDNAFKNQQFDQQKASTLWDQTFKDNSFKQSVNQFAQQMGLDYSKMNQQQQQFVADMAFKNKAQELQQAQFDYSKDPNSPDNLYKASQAAKDNALAIKANNDAQKNAIDTAYKDAVQLAEKDPRWSMMSDADRTKLIDTHYGKLKPGGSGVSDSDISQFLKK